MSDYIVKRNNFKLLDQQVKISLKTKTSLTIGEFLSAQEEEMLIKAVIQSAQLNAMNQNIIIQLSARAKQYDVTVKSLITTQIELIHKSTDNCLVDLRSDIDVKHLTKYPEEIVSVKQEYQPILDQLQKTNSAGVPYLMSQIDKLDLIVQFLNKVKKNSLKDALSLVQNLDFMPIKKYQYAFEQNLMTLETNILYLLPPFVALVVKILS